MFRIFELDLVLNDTHYSEVWIDPHYEAKHSNSINDELILSLLIRLDNEEIDPATESNGFRYFEVDMEHKKKLYRIILVIPKDNSYVGVRNAYRRSK